ncbi:MAG: hypothetical protein QOJ02_3811 [Acidobacteriota bacterium]|jgi:hypothetical protein|nr:hypothetical protein [Acidobacteriota bacterium]
MKSKPQYILSLIGLALCVSFGVALTAQAQNREKYIISATAGGINFVSGNVTVQRRGASRQEGLTVKDNLRTGDSVTTGAGGRVEVLLNPGSYMRVDENSEFELTDASLDNLRVRLVKGSALLEATGVDNTKLEIGIITPQTDVLVIRRGIYRFDALPDETTEVSVQKGRALYGKGFLDELKGGQKLVIGRNRLEIAKLDKKNKDTLDLWSKERAETLAQANRRLQTRSLISAFDAFNDMRGFATMSARYGLGLWVFNPRLGIYCFLPYGWSGWSSPYGYGYNTAFGFNGNGGWGNPGYGNPSQGNGGATGTTGQTGGNTGGNRNLDPGPVTQPTYQPTYREPPSQPTIERSSPREGPVRQAPPMEATNPN